MKTQENLVETYFPITKHCNHEHIKWIQSTCLLKKFKKNETIFHGGDACSGLIAIVSGQLRAFVQSQSGKQVTLYRLNEFDVCIMSASCLLKNITFDIHLHATTDTTVLIIPTATIELINQVNPMFRQYTLDLLTQRFSDVMWVVEQIVFSPLPGRIAHVILDNLSPGDDLLTFITHEDIAKELGSAREVISRILKYFEKERLILLSRRKIQVIDAKRLEAIITSQD